MPNAHRLMQETFPSGPQTFPEESGVNWCPNTRQSYQYYGSGGRQLQGGCSWKTTGRARHDASGLQGCPGFGLGHAHLSSFSLLEPVSSSRHLKRILFTWWARRVLPTPHALKIKNNILYWISPCPLVLVK